jgi:drug/metabolite transporter (DMT)-like permease
VDEPRTALVHSNLVGVLALAPTMPAVWVWPQSMGAGVALFVVAAFGAFGHLLIILAHRRASAGALAPFVYVQLLFMIAAGWIFFGDEPGPSTLAGAGIVVASGLYLLARERKVKGK